MSTVAAMSLVMFIGSASGCLISSSNSSYETGRRVSQDTMSQVEIGHTSEAWLIATLGEPTTRTTVQGSEHICILRYDYQQRKESGGAVFLLFAGSSSSSNSHSTFFETTHGVVSRMWTE
ncbi:MAG: hypothetical protein ACR2GY_13500 [Phycisphaerales bacterium]